MDVRGFLRLLTAFLALGSGLAGCGESSTNPCNNVSCSSRGTCIVQAGDPWCICLPGYHPEGLTCVEDPVGDPCGGVTCNAHGTCRSAGTERWCDCESGYHHLEGAECAEYECDVTCLPGDVPDADAGADVEADGEPTDDGGDADGTDVEAETTPVCGNGLLEDGEECDDGNDVAGDGCQRDCTFTCHDHTECADADQCTTDLCAASDGGQRCTNEIASGQACDDGNPCTADDACDGAGACVGGTSTCACVATSDCAPYEDGNLCNGTLICEAGSHTCEIDPATIVSCDPAADTTCSRNTCVPATGLCQLTPLPDGLPCDDALFCTLTDACLAGACAGTGDACPVGGCVAGCDEGTDRCRPATGGIVCRATAGDCDLAEQCDGTTTACPADGFLASSTTCRAAGGDCDLPEVCSGTSPACPADALAPATTGCRAAAGPCDVAEACTGTTPDCPADRFASGGTECRTAAGICDVAETCTGSGAACPADSFASSATECRAAAGTCDVAESCSGSGAACPADAFALASTVCRPSGGPCDAVENCTGTAAACPADSFAAGGTECRAAAGLCDAAESCSGTAAACPVDGFLPSSTVCRTAAGLCDVAESCSGTAAACPTDGFRAAGFVCRTGTLPCDPAETCPGGSADCPADAFAPNTTTCSDGITCTNPDRCDGAGSCAGIPTVAPNPPANALPTNGTRTGSLLAPAARRTLRPLFRWSPPAADGCTYPITYEVQVDDSCTTMACAFASPEASATGITALNWRPTSDLAVSSTAPVGRRYYWRVRACRAAVCSSWLVRYVDVGREPDDFNGDGYADVLVGVPYSSSGRVFVYLGGSTMDATRDLTLLAGATDDDFGFAVAGAGDVNADGFADFLVGAPLADPGSGTDAGQAYLYLGGATLDDVIDLSIAGSASGDRLGHAVAGAGDLNADGFAEFAVGLPYYHTNNYGRVHVFNGGATPDATVDVTLSQTVSDDQFGTALAGAGDVNGDGYHDLVVGTPMAAASCMSWEDCGRADVFFGGAPMNATIDITMNGAADDDHLGLAVAGVGDVNGDGYDDVLVGIPDLGATNAGAANLYLGGNPMNATADAAFAGETSGDRFGTAVTGVGDSNGDDAPDLAIGAPNAESGGTDRGRAYLYLGSSSGTPDTAADLYIPGLTNGDQLGTALAGAGDVEADGYADLVAGVPYRDPPTLTDAGAGFVYRLGPAADGGVDIELPGITNSGRAGTSVAALDPAVPRLARRGHPDWGAARPTRRRRDA